MLQVSRPGGLLNRFAFVDSVKNLFVHFKYSARPKVEQVNVVVSWMFFATNFFPDNGIL